MKNLYLFDIDGTLVDTIALHLASYKSAYKVILGIDVSEETLLSKFGKPEIQLHEEIFKELQISQKKKINEIIGKYMSGILEELESMDMSPLPGAREFLEYLKNHEELMGIVTGNPQEMGNHILEKAKLTGFFSIFSYYNDSISSRTEIVRNAINQATERDYKFNKIVVIGDTPSDVKSGKSVGAFTVGVKTGPYDDGLNSADLVLETLKEYKKILSALKE